MGWTSPSVPFTPSWQCPVNVEYIVFSICPNIPSSSAHPQSPSLYSFTFTFGVKTLLSFKMHFINALLAAGFLASAVTAHAGHHDLPSMSQIQRRSTLANRCAGAVGDMNKKRWAKRQAKRGPEARAGNATFEITTEAPYYDVLQNDTCVLTPTVTEGPVRFVPLSFRPC